jgi:hypothetical protein
MSNGGYWTLIGLLATGGFALWRIISGHYVINLTTQIETQRTASNRVGDKDHLVTVIRLKKGMFSTATLEKLMVRVLAEDSVIYVRDIRAVHVADDRYLNMSPGEETQFAAHCEVAAGDVCEIEVEVAGRRWEASFVRKIRLFAKEKNLAWGGALYPAECYWRAVAISAPLPPRDSTKPSLQ